MLGLRTVARPCAAINNTRDRVLFRGFTFHSFRTDQRKRAIKEIWAEL